MKSRLLGIAFGLFLFSNVQAVLIVDTGPGALMAPAAYALDDDQWLAGQFTITNSYVVTSVEGWLCLTSYPEVPGPVTAAIYTDDGSGKPITKLFAQEFILDTPSLVLNEGFVNAWDGAFELNWLLYPGTYWLAFEVQPGDTTRGGMSYETWGAPNPLPRYNVGHSPPPWTTYPPDRDTSVYAFGMRINADPAPTAPALDIQKLTNGNQADGANDPDVPRIAPGETVTWTYQVTNTGDVDVGEAELVVTDSQPGITPVLDLGSDDGDSILSPGETWIYTATAQAVDLSTPPAGVTVVPGCNDGRNTYENKGRAEVKDTEVFDEDPSHYCNFGVADIDIRKQAEGPDTRTIFSGSDVTFEIQVTNNGLMDLNNVVVTDGPAPQCDNVIDFLGIGADVVYSCTVPNVVNSFANEACVAGESLEGVPVQDCDPSVVEVINIQIRKQEEGADTRSFPSGSDVPFDIVVTNTGDEDLSNVTVTDPDVPDCDRNIGDLAADADAAYICTAPNVTLGFTNVACVDAERGGVPIQDCDPSTVEVFAVNEPPDCSAAVASVDTIWPANNQNFVAVGVLGVTDPDGDPVTVTINSIFQDEPVASDKKGRFVPDGGGIGTSVAQVRAERVKGKDANGRVYHIGFTADDGQGGACVDEVTVGVPVNRKAVPVDDGALYDSTVTP